MTAHVVPARYYLPSSRFTPAYLSLGVAELRRRAQEALDLLRDCVACPRDCHVNRLEDHFAVCKTGRYAIVGSVFPHFGEEDCLRGWHGSGTIFFSMCNLRCVFCCPPDTRVLTHRGPERIETLFDRTAVEVAAGEARVRFPGDLRTWTHSGASARVSKIFRHAYAGEIVVITPAGLPALAVTPNHEVFVISGDAPTPCRVPAGELTERHRLLAPHPAGPAPVAATGRGRERWRTSARGRDDPLVLWGEDGLRRSTVGTGQGVPIRSIERRRYDGFVFNLEVDHPDHSFVASGVAVANCQNYDISQAGEGRVVTPAQLAAMMLDLQDQGCHNINFVTPEHVVPQILEALPIAVEAGLRLPIVYNTSSYDSMHSLRLMDGIVDIYMPDFKYWSPERARHYLKAPDYPEVARRVIAEMHRQVGPLRLDEYGLARRGVLIRHLVMPGALEDTRAIMAWIARTLGRDAYVNVMDQYHPAGQVGRNPKYEDINRRLFREEFLAALQAAREAGLWRLDARIPRRPSIRWIPVASAASPGTTA